jgi:hypothetical protein
MKIPFRKHTKNPLSNSEMFGLGIVTIVIGSRLVRGTDHGAWKTFDIIFVLIVILMIVFSAGVRAVKHSKKETPEPATKNEDYSDVVPLMQQFIDGKGHYRDFTNKIEGILTEKHLDSPLYEALAEPLASYNPGGGEPGLINDEQLTAEFKYALEHIVAPDKGENRQ